MKRRPPAAAPKPKKKRPVSNKPPATSPINDPVLIPTFGRTQKPITPELIDRMCQVIRAGGNVEEAALTAGISPAHFFRWQASVRQKPTPTAREFLEALDSAKRARSLRLKLRYQSLAKDDPKALQWWLERDPITREEFKPPKVTILVEEELTHAVDALEAEFASEPEVLDRILSAIARAHRTGEAGGAEEEQGGGDDRASGEAVHAAHPEP